MSHLDFLMRYVRTGTAEGDKAFLGRAFISPGELAELLGIEPGGMRILVGNKGMGKTAILEWLQEVALKRKLPCVLLRPDNLDTKNLPSVEDVGALKRHFFETLIHALSAQVGSQLKGMLSKDAGKLQREAIAAGLSSEDAIQRSLTLLNAVALPVTKVDGVKLAKDLSGQASPSGLIRAIQTQLLTDRSIMFLLIDDTDQVATPAKAAHLNRIWALLLAVRRLAAECPSVKPIVSLRTEVWTRLASESDGQRDQTDHMRGSRVTLKATDSMIESIVRRRLELAAADANVRGVDPYTVFFADTHVLLPTSVERRTWDSFLSKSSRERPRDAIQLIKNMIDSARKFKAEKMGSEEANDGMKVYSKERVDDVNNEFAPDCSAIRQMLNTFADVDFEAPFETIRRHIRTIPSGFPISIRGRQMRPDSDQDMVVMLSLLHEAGFLNARVNDVRMPRGFRHILFTDNPNFVTMANWNEMQSATWEVHPAFRSYLISERDSQLARVRAAGKA